MKAIPVLAAAILTAGTATAQTQTYNTGNATMIVTEDMCGITFKGSSSRVYVSQDGTKIIDGKDVYIVTRDGTIAGLGGASPSGEKAEILAQMANKSRESCESAVKAMELEEAQ